MSKVLTTLAAIAVTAVVAAPTVAGAAERHARNDRVTVSGQVRQNPAWEGYQAYGYLPGSYDDYLAQRAKERVTATTTFGF